MDLEYSEDEPFEVSSLVTKTIICTGEWSEGCVNNPVITLCALSGLQGSQTIYIVGYSCKRPLQVLLDGGITHNFIDVEVAKFLGCKITPTKVGYVNLGNTLWKLHLGL